MDKMSTSVPQKGSVTDGGGAIGGQNSGAAGSTSQTSSSSSVSFTGLAHCQQDLALLMQLWQQVQQLQEANRQLEVRCKGYQTIGHLYAVTKEENRQYQAHLTRMNQPPESLAIPQTSGQASARATTPTTPSTPSTPGQDVRNQMKQERTRTESTVAKTVTENVSSMSLGAEAATAGASHRGGVSETPSPERGVRLEQMDPCSTWSMTSMTPDSSSMEIIDRFSGSTDPYHQQRGSTDPAEVAKIMSVAAALSQYLGMATPSEIAPTFIKLLLHILRKEKEWKSTQVKTPHVGEADPERLAATDRLLQEAVHKCRIQERARLEIVQQLRAEAQRREKVEGDLNVTSQRLHQSEHKVQSLSQELARATMEISRLRNSIDTISGNMCSGNLDSLAMLSPGELRTEVQVLRHQVNIFKDDFDRERTDRQQAQHEKDDLQTALIENERELDRTLQLLSQKGVELQAVNQQLAQERSLNRHLSHQLAQRTGDLQRSQQNIERLPGSYYSRMLGNHPHDRTTERIRLNALQGIYHHDIGSALNAGLGVGPAATTPADPPPTYTTQPPTYSAAIAETPGNTQEPRPRTRHNIPAPPNVPASSAREEVGGASAAAASSRSQPWPCPDCTYMNNSTNLTCSVCGGTPRNAYRPAHGSMHPSSFIAHSGGGSGSQCSPHGFDVCDSGPSTSRRVRQDSVPSVVEDAHLS